MLPIERILITGASRGLGLETARVLAARGIPLVLANRTTRGELRVDGANVDVAQLDVSDLDAVRSFAASLSGTRLSAIVCNAGVQIVGDVQMTTAGFEETCATNHLGHFLLVRLLLGQLAPEGRVVFVASDTHDPKQRTGMPAPDARDIEAVVRGEAFSIDPPALAGRRRYTTSKLFNVLCTYELDRRLATSSQRPSSVFAFDPGMMPGTGLAREYGPLARWAWRTLMPLMTLVVPNVNTVRTSSRRLAALAMGHVAAPSGTYISRGRVSRSSEDSYDEALARRLWESSSRHAGVSVDLSKGRP